MCASYMAQLYLISFSSIQTQSHCSSFFLSTWSHSTHRRIQAWAPHHRRHHPRRQAEALHRRSLAGCEAHLGANHPDTLTSMSNLADLLRKQGKLDEAGLRVFGVRGDLTGRFTKGIFLFGQGLRPGFSLVNFPILLDYLFWA